MEITRLQAICCNHSTAMLKSKKGNEQQLKCDKPEWKEEQTEIEKKINGDKYNDTPKWYRNERGGQKINKSREEEANRQHGETLDPLHFDPKSNEPIHKRGKSKRFEIKQGKTRWKSRYKTKKNGQGPKMNAWIAGFVSASVRVKHKWISPRPGRIKVDPHELTDRNTKKRKKSRNKIKQSG